VTDEDWVEFSGDVATTHPMTVYDGFRLEREQIIGIVDALNGGALPMLGHHDRLRPVRTRRVRASAVRLVDGELAARLVGEARADDWNSSVGVARQFSFAAGIDLDPELWPDPTDPQVRVAADAAWFAASDIADASRAVGRLGPVKAQEYYQFSAVADAKIVIDAAWPFVSAFGVGLFTNAVWDGVKLLLARRRVPDGADPSSPTTVEVHAIDGDRKTVAVVRTDDPAVAERAIAALEPVLRDLMPQDRSAVLEWHDGGGGPDRGWAPPA
jgi:hypothetical protein